MTAEEFDRKVESGEPITHGDLYLHDQGWEEATRRLRKLLDRDAAKAEASKAEA